MDNLEKWHFYNKDIASPSSYIDWSFYSIIATALQRKVFRGQRDRSEIFPNLYVILVGPPGVGKGMIIKPSNKILRFHKRDEATPAITKEELREIKSAEDAIRKAEKPLLIPMGPEATTYEALVKIVSRNCRSMIIPVGENKKRIIPHSSIGFCLEEMSSLFRKHLEDLVNFLLVTYDCGDYTYETLSRGEDKIQNCCLNLLAGTTPSFMKTVFSDNLLNEGFGSRAIFVVETKPRSRKINPGTYSEEQVQAYTDILAHVKSLGSLQGEVKFTDEASEFLAHWWENEEEQTRPNKSPKLIPYYARKNITVNKLAMIKHFMDNTTLLVNLEECQWAIKTANEVEVKMHGAVTLDNINPLANATENIYQYLITHGNKARKELYIEFFGEVPNGTEDIDKILNYLQIAKRVELENGKLFKAIKKE